MPIGSSSVVPYVVSELIARRPRTVLDLGCGFGWAAAAIRQWLDQGVQPWRTRIEAVESFAAYKNPAWSLYDAVYNWNLLDWVAHNRRDWDAILLLDVLEHFDHAEGESLLTKLRCSLTPSGVLLVATPAIWHPQGAVHGNEHETHRSLWTADELRALGFAVLWDGELDRWGQQMLVASAAR